ncbi:hypothetical protein [Salana multivorans]
MPSERTNTLRRVGAWIAERPLPQLGLAAAVVVVAATAAWGGFEPVEGTGAAPAELKPGETATAAPLEITLERARWIDELPGAYLSDPDNRWIALVGTIENTDDATYLLPQQSLVVSGADGLDPAGLATRAIGIQPNDLLVVTDASRLSAAQPGLTYEVVFLVEQDGTLPPPEEITVELLGRTEREDTLSRQMSWLDPTVVASITLPVSEASGNQDTDQDAAQDGEQDG